MAKKPPGKDAGINPVENLLDGTTGTKNRNLNMKLINQAAASLWIPEGTSEDEKIKHITSAISLLKGIKPVDEIESMLASQMIGTHSAAMPDKALVAYVRHDYPLALKLWLPLARAGDAEAQISVAQMYSGTLNGLVRDDIEAAKWLRLAAAQGEALAMEDLGEFYADGRTGSLDRVQAYVWFSEASQLYTQMSLKGLLPAAVLKRRDALPLDTDALARAQKLALQWRESQFKACEPTP
jgi:hypothetical protein